MYCDLPSNGATLSAFKMAFNAPRRSDDSDMLYLERALAYAAGPEEAAPVNAGL